MAIGGIKSLGSINPQAIYAGVNPGGPVQRPFGEHLQQAIKEVDNLQAERAGLVEDMVSGRVTEVHDVMIAAEEAQLAFELLLEVRNKLLESYQEIMRMQV